MVKKCGEQEMEKLRDISIFLSSINSKLISISVMNRKIWSAKYNFWEEISCSVFTNLQQKNVCYKLDIAN